MTNSDLAGLVLTCQVLVQSKGQIQNQTWQVKNQTCQVKVKIRSTSSLDLAGLVLTARYWFNQKDK